MVIEEDTAAPIGEGDGGGGEVVINVVVAMATTVGVSSSTREITNAHGLILHNILVEPTPALTTVPQ
eukprot:m.186552 g.186552  ORF g.186552 m.186552 type:complete len:67 (-) comp18491_c1_seq96:280-480(-)